jgi:DNA-binding IclR family transcriptional regulator
VEDLIERGLPAYTPYTLVTAERLRQALEVTRQTRLALCRWELELGVATIAAPVLAEGGGVLAAIELRVRDLRQDLHTMQPALTIAAGCLSRELAAVPAMLRPAVAVPAAVPVDGRAPLVPIPAR